MQKSSQEVGSRRSKLGVESIEDLTKQIAKGGGIAFIGSVIAKVATFGLHILLGRVLGPGGYGLYALGVSVAGIAQSIASLGLGQGVVRFCAIYRGKGDNARVKGTILSALIISTISSMSVGVILFALSSIIAQRFFHKPELTWVLRIFALAIPFYVLMGITTSFAQSFRRIEYQQGVQNIFRPLVNLLAVSLAFLLGFRLAGAVYGFLFSGIVSAGLGFYFLRKIFPEFTSISRRIYQGCELLRFSIPMLLIGISYFLLTYTDRIMLGYFKKASDIGIYNAASVISSQLTLFLSAFIAIFSPMVSDLYNRGDLKRLEKLFTVVTRWVLTLTFPLFITLAIFSRDVMLIFGPEFGIGWKVVILLGVAQLINVGTGPVGVILQMTGKQDIDFANGIVLLFSNIGLNIWLIPTYGILGAAIATAISLILIHTLRLIEVIKILKMFPYDKHCVKPIIAGAATLFAGMILKINFLTSPHLNLILAGVTSLLIIYFGVLLAIGLDQRDKMVLSAIKAKIFVR